MESGKLTWSLRIGWYAIYVVAGVIALLFELGTLDKGSVTDAGHIYIMQIVGVMSALAMIPLALGGFKKMMDRIGDKPFEDRLKIYVICSWLRLSAFFIVVGYGLVLYYLINDDIGLYCAVIGAICSMFCYPSKGAIEYDLNWDERV